VRQRLGREKVEGKLPAVKAKNEWQFSKSKLNFNPMGNRNK